MASIYEMVEQGSLLGVLSGMRAGQDPNAAPQESYCTPLGRAAELGHRDIVLLLSGNPNTILSGFFIDGGSTQCPPISLAAKSGHADVVDTLIALGCDVNERLGDVTPLKYAVCSSSSSLHVSPLWRPVRMSICCQRPGPPL